MKIWKADSSFETLFSTFFRYCTRSVRNCNGFSDSALAVPSLSCFLRYQAYIQITLGEHAPFLMAHYLALDLKFTFSKNCSVIILSFHQV